MYRFLDVEKVCAFFDAFTPYPIECNDKECTMIVEFYYLETEDTQDGAMTLFYKFKSVM